MSNFCIYRDENNNAVYAEVDGKKSKLFDKLLEEDINNAEAKYKISKTTSFKEQVVKPHKVNFQKKVANFLNSFVKTPQQQTAKFVTQFLKSKGFNINVLSEQEMIAEAKKRGYDNFDAMVNSWKGINEYEVFDDRELSDTITLKFNDGSVTIGEVFGLYDFLEDYESEFTNPDSFFEIQYLQIKPEFQGQGKGKQLLKDTINYIQENFGNKDIYLNASPIGNRALSAKGLSNFYVNEGFKVIEDEGSNITMVRKGKSQNIQFLNQGEKIHGFYDTNTGEIYLTEELLSSESLVHEMWHSFRPILKQKAEQGDQTAKEVLNQMESISFKDILGGEQALKDKYKSLKSKGKGLDFSVKSNFENWKGKNRVVEASEVQDVKTGEPVVVRSYHGTTNEFYEFDSSVKGTVESHLGKVNYFTTDYQDAAMNYQADGADITGRIDRRAEQIEQQLEDDLESLSLEGILEEYRISKEELKELYPEGVPEDIEAKELSYFLAERELKGDTEQVLDLYVKLNNPVVIGKGTNYYDFTDRSQFEDYIEEATEEVVSEYDITEKEAKEDYLFEIEMKAMEMSGYENPLIRALSDAIEKNTDDYERAMGKASEILADFYDSDINLNQLEKALREGLIDETNEEGDMSSSQIVSDFFKNLGFDGIILTDVSQRFSGMQLGGTTSHVHVFDEYNNQIKLADGSNVDFGETSNIYYMTNQLSSEVYNPREGETYEQYRDRMIDEASAILLQNNSEEYFEKIAKANGLNETETKSFIQRIKDFIKDFGEWLTQQLGIENTSPEEIANLTQKELFDRITTSMLSQSQENIQLKYNSKGQHLAPNGKPSNLTEAQAKQVRTKAFKDWFGDWENDLQNASKVVDENGEPMVVYHGTSTINLTEFEKRREGTFFTDNIKTAKGYANNIFPETIGVFLNIKNPTINSNSKYWDKIFNESVNYIDIRYMVDEVVEEDAYIEVSKNGGESQYFKIEELLKDIEKNPKEYPYNIKEEIEENIRLFKEEGEEKFTQFNQYFTENETNISPTTTDIFSIDVFRGTNSDGVIFKNISDDTHKTQTISNIFVTKNPNQIKSATDNIGTFDPNNNDIRFQTNNIKNGLRKQGTQGAVRESSKGNKVEKELRVLIGGYDKAVETNNPIENRDRLKRETFSIEQWAKDNGYFIENIESKYTPTELGGAESEIFLDKNNTDVIIKEMNPGAYNGYAGVLGRLALHRKYFPETAYEIIGFTKEGDVLNVVLKQDFVKNARNATQQEIFDYLNKLEFYVDSSLSNSYVWKNGKGVTIGDMHDGNALVTDSGAIVVIDPMIKYEGELPLKDYLDKSLSSQNIQGQTSSLNSISRNKKDNFTVDEFDGNTVYNFEDGKVGLEQHKDGKKVAFSNNTNNYRKAIAKETEKGNKIYKDREDSIWDNLEENNLSSTENEETYIKQSGELLDNNNEPSVEAVNKYITSRELEDNKLTKADEADLMEALVDYESSEDMLSKMEKAMMPSGVFSPTFESLTNNGYTETEALNILDDLNLQNKLKNNIGKLRNAENIVSEYQVPKYRKHSSEARFDGSFRTENPFILRQEAIELLGGKNKDDFDNTVKSNELFYAKDDFAELSSYQKINKKEIVNNEVVDYKNRTKNVMEETIIEPSPEQNQAMQDIVYDIISVDNETIEANKDDYYRALNDLKTLSAELGLDLSRPFSPNIDKTKEFITEVADFFVENDFDRLANAYDNYYNIESQQEYEFVKNANKKNVIVENPKPVELMFSDHRLLKQSDGTYRPVDTSLSVEEMYEVLESYKDNTDRKDIEDQVNTFLERQGLNKSDINKKFILYNMYYNDSMVFNDNPKENIKYMLNQEAFNFDVEQALSEINRDLIKEKVKNSEKYKNFYSNLKATKYGIKIINSDPISMKKMELYMTDKVRNHILSQPNSQIKMPEAETKDLYNLYNRNFYINFAENAPKPEGLYSFKTEDVVETKNKEKDFINIEGDVFENTNDNFYRKLPNNNSNYIKLYKIDPEGYSSEVNSRPPEISVKKNYNERINREFKC